MKNDNKPGKEMESIKPWGYFTLLAPGEKEFQVKKIVVYPNSRLSLQRHRLRSEHIYIISGNALITLNNDEIHLKPGESIDIPIGSIHRISNIGDDDVVLLEIESGQYIEENDEERFEDDYGRT